MKRVAVTTFDNPYDPIKDFDRWYSFDQEHNYLTCELLDRLAIVTDAVSEDQNMFEIESAIDAMVEMHPTLYKKIKGDY